VDIGHARNSEQKMITPTGFTLRDLFNGALERFGDRVAVVHDGARVSYREFCSQANRLAHGLQQLGIGAGSPVALMVSNRPECLIADQAILCLGAAKVPLNRMLSAGEIAFILEDSGASVAIADAELLAAALAADAPSLSHIIAVDEPVGRAISWASVLGDEVRGNHPPEVEPQPGDAAAILYTGGTTGRQKGVVHSQHGLAVNILAHLIEIGLHDDERLLLTTPLPHAAGPIAQAGLLKGSAIYLEDRFDPIAVLDRIQSDRITFTFMVPTMIYRVLDKLADHGTDLTSLRTVLYGAAPIARDRLEDGLRRLGPVFMQLYGQAEAPNFIARLTREDHDLNRPGRLTSCGRQSLLTEVAVLDSDGRPLDAGQSGEICVRGPYVMVRYHNLPDKTDDVLRDGWLHTGDIGFIDEEQFIHLLDRKNDMIISGGMNVYSAEVENVLQELPDISQVAVLGLPHPDWGEAVAAFVVAEPGFDESRAADHCRATLAVYKRPKTYVRVDELPTTAYGKVDKKSLRRGAARLATITQPVSANNEGRLGVTNTNGAS
jgi:fatty-acyl-CoA synthase